MEKVFLNAVGTIWMLVSQPGVREEYAFWHRERIVLHEHILPFHILVARQLALTASNGDSIPHGHDKHWKLAILDRELIKARLGVVGLNLVRVAQKKVVKFPPGESITFASHGEECDAGRRVWARASGASLGETSFLCAIS